MKATSPTEHTKATPKGGQLFALAALLGGIALAACQWLIFVYAPVEQHMGIIQKIFYIHLPLAWWGLFSFLIVFIASIAYLCTKKTFWDTLAGAAGEVGVLLATLALITGSIWAKRSWGVWWTWDPRLTTTLIMWFIYTGYLVLRTMDMPEERRARVAAVVGIVAFLDVPLVFFSARLWRSIHPAVFASKEGGMESEMKITVITCVIVFGLIWASLTAFRHRLAVMEKQVDSLAMAQRTHDF